MDTGCQNERRRKRAFAYNIIWYADTLKFELEKTGVMSALPYLVMAIVLQFAGHLADWLRSSGILTTTQVYVAYQDAGCDVEELGSLGSHVCHSFQYTV